MCSKRQLRLKLRQFEILASTNTLQLFALPAHVLVVVDHRGGQRRVPCLRLGVARIRAALQCPRDAGMPESVRRHAAKALDDQRHLRPRGTLAGRQAIGRRVHQLLDDLVDHVGRQMPIA